VPGKVIKTKHLKVTNYTADILHILYLDQMFEHCGAWVQVLIYMRRKILNCMRRTLLALYSTFTELYWDFIQFKKKNWFSCCKS